MSAIRIDLNPSLSWQSFRSGCAAFLAWWRAELLRYLPPRWSTRLGIWFGRWTVVFTLEHVSLVAPGRAHPELVFEAAEEPGALRERVLRFDASMLQRAVSVQIPRNEGFISTVRLPKAAASRLRAVIGLQLARLSPIPVQNVCFDCRVLDNVSEGEIEAEVAIIPLATLKAYESRLRAVGFVPAIFELQDTPFTVATENSGRTTQERLQQMLLAATISLWLFVLIAAPLLRQNEVASLATETAHLRASAQEAIALQQQIGRLRAPYGAAAQMAREADPLETIRLLSEVLPVDVQLTSLGIDGQTLRISGTGHDARAILRLLAGQDGFSNVHLSGPVGQTSDGRTRFDIECVLTREKTTREVAR